MALQLEKQSRLFTVTASKNNFNLKVLGNLHFSYNKPSARWAAKINSVDTRLNCRISHTRFQIGHN